MHGLRIVGFCLNGFRSLCFGLPLGIVCTAIVWKFLAEGGWKKYITGNSRRSIAQVICYIG